MKDIHKIADHYGLDNQIIQCVEELTELACELLHYKKRGFSYNDLVQEIADVEVMLEQIKYLFNIKNAMVDRIKGGKINRQLERIQKELE